MGEVPAQNWSWPGLQKWSGMRSFLIAECREYLCKAIGEVCIFMELSKQGRNCMSSEGLTVRIFMMLMTEIAMTFA